MKFMEKRFGIKNDHSWRQLAKLALYRRKLKMVVDDLCPKRNRGTMSWTKLKKQNKKTTLEPFWTHSCLSIKNKGSLSTATVVTQLLVFHICSLLTLNLLVNALKVVFTLSKRKCGSLTFYILMYSIHSSTDKLECLLGTEWMLETRNLVTFWTSVRWVIL